MAHLLKRTHVTPGGLSAKKLCKKNEEGKKEGSGSWIFSKLMVEAVTSSKLRFGQMSDARTLSDDTKLKLATLPVTARPQAGKDGTSTNSAKPDAFDSQDVPSGMSVGSLVPSAISIGEGSGMSDTVDPKPSSSPENNASSVGDQMRRSILSTTGVDLDEKKKHESKKCRKCKNT